MLTLKKGEDVKILSLESTLIDRLKADGWTVDGETVSENSDNELDDLRAEAKALGIEVHHRAGVDKIREMIATAKAVE